MALLLPHAYLPPRRSGTAKHPAPSAFLLLCAGRDRGLLPRWHRHGGSGGRGRIHNLRLWRVVRGAAAGGARRWHARGVRGLERGDGTRGATAGWSAAATHEELLLRFRC
ncbi:hypothetical protein PVAP13_8KG323133 [Panicum virgatum]|uniref:Uncharacterized protein n=1 Tax=Panicum virgatum TaxID=38727 RepID=A0A8T0PL10_PANVG|nr:hypothetical protein PVAP13_8KG323133 [Panicum virgatum]